MEGIAKVIKFLEEHQALLMTIPGAVEGLIDAIRRIVNRPSTDPEKQARVNELAAEILAMATEYRQRPPELPR